MTSEVQGDGATFSLTSINTEMGASEPQTIQLPYLTPKEEAKDSSTCAQMRRYASEPFTKKALHGRLPKRNKPADKRAQVSAREREKIRQKKLIWKKQDKEALLRSESLRAALSSALRESGYATSSAKADAEEDSIDADDEEDSESCDSDADSAVKDPSPFTKKRIAPLSLSATGNLSITTFNAVRDGEDGISAFVTACKELNIVPLTALMHIDGINIDLSHYHMGDKSACSHRDAAPE